jgi:hypothetical protein
MPICIAGMPCSGTSMVAQILCDLGLDVGSEEEVERGSRGTGPFSRLNDEILAALGAAWDSPPAEGERWAGRPELQPLRQRASAVADALALAEPWGWADPRNTLTLPFWDELFPDLRVVLCVRHPLEVAESLEARGSSSLAGALGLWRSYYGGAAAKIDDDDRIVTDYARYQKAPAEEVERLAEAVGLTPSRGEIRRAVASLARRGREETHADETELPPDVHGLYRTLLEAAATRSRALPAVSAPALAPAAPGDADEQVALAAQRRELEHLRLELARRRGHVEELQAQLDLRAAAERDLPVVIHNLEEQLRERDEEIAVLRENIGRRLHAEDSLKRAVAALEKELATVETTRLWRAGKSYWSLKRRIRQALGRERP